MAEFYRAGAFSTVRRHFVESRTISDMLVNVSIGDDHMSLSPDEAYGALYGPQADAALGAEVWKAVIRAAQEEGEPHGGWRPFLVRLAEVRLRRSARKIATGLRDSVQDIESEMVLGLLEALPEVDPESPCAPGELLSAARRKAGRFRRAVQPMTPVAYVEDIARSDEVTAAGSPPDDLHDWEVEVSPSAGSAGFRASLRLPVSAAQVEGERLGALASRLGLEWVVLAAERSRGRHRTGTITLRSRRRPSQ